LAEDESFIEEWRPFVANIAHRIRAQLDFRGELDDLMGWGFEGLLAAKSRYDASRGVQFNTFAYYRVRGAMLDGIRAQAFLPSRLHNLRKAAEATDDLLEHEGEQKALATGTSGPPSAEKAAEALDSLLGKLTASYVLASLGQGDEDQPVSPEDATVEAQAAARVRDAVSSLPERERSLIDGFYFQGRSFEEVAAELGISKSWTSRLHTKALSLLREALESLA
jgi:RNA polymerase sigma factor for flagellar operon FliA